MKYTVYYNVPMKVEFEYDGFGGLLEAHAIWAARNKSGANVELVQILPEGVPSQLLRDQPPDRGPGSGGSPPTGPLAPGGDQLLAQVA